MSDRQVVQKIRYCQNLMRNQEKLNAALMMPYVSAFTIFEGWNTTSSISWKPLQLIMNPAAQYESTDMKEAVLISKINRARKGKYSIEAGRRVLPSECIKKNERTQQRMEEETDSLYFKERVGKFKKQYDGKEQGWYLLLTFKKKI